MHLNVLETLGAVLRTGSLAGAAAQMYLTPSAVSMQIKPLQTHFGQPLVAPVRSSRELQRGDGSGGSGAAGGGGVNFQRFQAASTALG